MTQERRLEKKLDPTLTPEESARQAVRRILRQQADVLIAQGVQVVGEGDKIFDLYRDLRDGKAELQLVRSRHAKKEN